MISMNDKVKIVFFVNGQKVSLDVSPSMTLLDILRKDLKLTGTKCGCGIGTCGSCIVIIDGRAQRSCLIRAQRLNMVRVETIESLSFDATLHPLQKAFIARQGAQCGFCTPGMIMSAKALLDTNPKPSIEEIKQLRESTGISVIECQKALKESGGDLEKAKEILKKWGKDFAKTRADRTAKQGIIDAYIHCGRKIGVMIELRCESDFVARSEDFKTLSHELCLQIAALSPEEAPLFFQPWIRDPNKTIKDLIDGYIAKLGENIILEKFVRYEL